MRQAIEAPRESRGAFCVINHLRKLQHLGNQAREQSQMATRRDNICEGEHIAYAVNGPQGAATNAKASALARLHMWLQSA